MISGRTKILGLIGNPVEHSVSPIMHNAAFEEIDLDYAYAAFKVEEDQISDAVRGIKSLNLTGVNVTIPHKSAIMEHLDEIDETSEKIGAINTIKNEKNRLIGFNTDGIGVLKSLEEKIGLLKDKKVLLLGAGGAARAIAYTLIEAGVDLTISNRTLSKAEELATEIEEKTGEKVRTAPQRKEKLSKTLESMNILVNSTSVGMHPNEDKTVLEASGMHKNLTVMDIVYNPLKTRLLEEAEKTGAETISGLGMLVHQGAASFKIWTGKKAPIETMKRAARKALKER